MPYLFKLSRRMARTRAALVLAAAAAAACESADLLPSSPQKLELATTAGTIGTVSDLRVTAASDTSLTIAFTAVDDSAGLGATYEVRYALSPIAWGSALTVARGTCVAPLGSAIESTKSCTILGLTPAKQYDVQLVAFSGTPNLNAVFGGLSNVATASTTATPAAPATVLLQEAFEDASFTARGWYDNTALAITTSQHIVGSTSALEVHFPVGATTPTWGGTARRAFLGTETVYLGYWVKYSSNWVGSGRAYHPHEFMLLTNEDAAYTGPSFTHLATYVEENYQNGGIPVLAMQDGANIDQAQIGRDLTTISENRGAAGCNGNTDGYTTDCYQASGVYVNAKTWQAVQPSFLPSSGTGYKGDWHFVEAYFKLNSIQNGKGVADGIVRYWFDRQLVIEHTNVLLRTGAHPTMKFNQLLIGPYIGDGSPVDQTMWVDNLTVGDGRIETPTVPSVASVTVTPASASVPVGGTVGLGVTLKDVSDNILPPQAVTWTSSNTAVATVSGSGVASGRSTGSATITATSGEARGTATLTVTAIPPGTVGDLAVAAKTDTSVTLSFTEVNDGTGQPASYDIRSAVGSLSWGSASDIGRGTCTGALAGTAIGAKRACTVSGLVAGTGYQFQLISFRGTLNVNAVFGALSNVAAGTTAVAAVPAGPPGAVGDLAVAAKTDTSVTLSFTEVNDGTGQPASYDIRSAVGSLSWGSASDIGRGTCTGALAGTAIGAKRACTVSGLVAGTGYQFQLISFRGTLNVNAVFGALSNVASGTTAGGAVPPPPLPPPPPPLPSTGWPHEPAGYRVITDYDMHALNDGGWLNSYPSQLGSGISLASVAGAPASAPTVWQFAYPAGYSGGSAPGTEYYPISAPYPTALYVGFWWKPSNPWQGHSSGVNKLMFVYAGGPPAGLIIKMLGTGSGPFRTQVTTEFGTTTNWNENVGSSSPLALGQWHRVEMFLNYAGGVLQWWVDGVLVGSYTGIGYPNSGFNQLEFSPTWGGVGDTKSQNEYFWYDQIRASRP